MTNTTMNDSAAMGTLLSYLRILENGDSPILQFIGKWVYKVYEERQTIEIGFMYLHLLLAALFPMFIGAYSSLRQPPSAARSLKDEEKEEDDEDDDEIKINTPVEGMSPSDAILYPITAGIVLTSMFLFIRFMGDAKLLNKIMTVYFSGESVPGKHVMRIMADLVQPQEYLLLLICCRMHLVFF
jgi:minor histocompatibility antigen H13